MKSLHDWRKEQLLEELSSEGCDLKNIAPDKIKSFTEWRMLGVLNEYLEEAGPPLSGAAAQSQQQAQAAPPDPNAAPPQDPNAPPPDPNAAPPGPPPGPDPNANVPPMGQPNAGGPDDKAIIEQLKGILGQQSKDDDFPIPAALKLEAKKVKERASEKKMDSGKGLQMWLWNCLNAWTKTKIDLPRPQQPQQQPPQPPQNQPQPPQGAPGAPPPGAPAPGM